MRMAGDKLAEEKSRRVFWGRNWLRKSKTGSYNRSKFKASPKASCDGDIGSYVT
jgi:hypothetical protein